MAKFLVLWNVNPGLVKQAVMTAVLLTQDYGKDLESKGKIERRYHVIGRHGGAWIYNVDSHEELDRLLAMSRVYNFAQYEVLALAEMSQTTVLSQSKT